MGACQTQVEDLSYIDNEKAVEVSEKAQISPIGTSEFTSEEPAGALTGKISQSVSPSDNKTCLLDEEEDQVKRECGIGTPNPVSGEADDHKQAEADLAECDSPDSSPRKGFSEDPGALTQLGSRRGFFFELGNCFDLASDSHQSCVVRHPKFQASKVLGVVVPNEMMGHEIDNMNVVQYLRQEKNMGVLMSIDHGLTPQSKGVQFLELSESFDQQLQRAIEFGACGAKICSVIREANAEGIAMLVEQQISIAKQIIAKGLLPALHIVVDTEVDDVKASRSSKRKLTTSAELTQENLRRPSKESSRLVRLPSKESAQHVRSPSKERRQSKDLTAFSNDMLKQLVKNHEDVCEQAQSSVKRPSKESSNRKPSKESKENKDCASPKGFNPEVRRGSKQLSPRRMSKPIDAEEVVLAQRGVAEEMLFHQLLAALGNLKADDRLMFVLSLPAKPNTYLSLVGHPNTVRVLATPGKYSLKEACAALEQNFGLVGAFGNILLEGAYATDSEDKLTSTLEVSISSVYKASVAVPMKEMQTTKVHNAEGFFACLDSSDQNVDKALARYRLGSKADYSSEAAAMDRLHEMRSRIFTNTKFFGSRVIGLLMSEDTVERFVDNKPSARYLWEEKQIVPFMTIRHGHRAEKDGVQLMQDISNLDKVLTKAINAGIYGVKACTLINKANAVGIQAAISQHILLSAQIMKKELVPVWHLEVEKDAVNKAACEELLLDILGRSLGQLRPEQKVIVWLAPPVNANLYLPLIGLPNVIRVVSVSGGHDRKQACSLVQQNFGMIGGFNRAFVEGLHSEQTDDEFATLLDESCEAIFQSSRSVPAKTTQTYKVSKQDGFFAALAHLGSRTQACIAAQLRYGTSGSEEEMAAVFERIVTNPQFNSLHVIGASLTTDYLSIRRQGQPMAKYLWQVKHMVPFLKIDVKGLAGEANGVQLMQEVPQQVRNNLLDTAVVAGIFGTTTMSRIYHPNSGGIYGVVEQQFEWARDVFARGLVPVMMMFIDKERGADIAKCERILRQALMTALRKLEEHEAVILNFVVPSIPGLYDCFSDHPKVLRVLATGESYTLEESCKMLAANAGLVANSGPVLLEKLGAQQTYAEFTEALGQSCAIIHKASREGKVKTKAG